MFPPQSRGTQKVFIYKNKNINAFDFETKAIIRKIEPLSDTIKEEEEEASMATFGQCTKVDLQKRNVQLFQKQENKM